MKNLVLCACILILAFQSSSSAKLKLLKDILESNFGNDIRTCMEENNATHSDWYEREDLMNHVYAEPENEERTRKVGCWIACVMKKQNFMEGANINEHEIAKKLQEIFPLSSDEEDEEKEKIYQIADKCTREVRIFTQECEKCFSLLTCVARRSQEERERQRNTETKEEAAQAE
ncbi:PREDICTED: pheromone-binding protein Gp-9-like [Wasmannia auropunctata]|uniref:pheromone-binding protein Gp-9-like n=1 Tax=Wasmannia auropunctata TaxID=64793 RepID=UPI0005EDAAEF|nr:PREDICTED: pheromone-binding protein Gp-9-like [Wasmannia auropunctata]